VISGNLLDRTLTTIVVTIAILVAQDAAAQAWPAKPVRMIIAFAPGGGTDIAGRLIAKRLTETLGQSFVVENRAGAGGIIGAEFVLRTATTSSSLPRRSRSTSTSRSSPSTR
jgi:tripartite-type tricarboxylate transporter receptor subunit TctC